jgi:hypothetical protein
MAQVQGKTAIFRAGKFVPGGTVITVTPEELPDFLDRGFVEVHGAPVVEPEDHEEEQVEGGSEPSSALPDSDPLAGVVLNTEQEQEQEQEPPVVESAPEEQAPPMRGRRRRNSED